MDCWNFKSDMRPSFAEIHDKLKSILDRYESKRQQLKLLEMEKLYDYSSAATIITTPCSLALQSLSNLTTPSHSVISKPANQELTSKLAFLNKTPKSSDLLLTTALKSHSNPLAFNTMSLLNRQGPLSSSRQSESDSQYFSGVDTSADGSNFSSSSSNYSSYSMSDNLKSCPEETALAAIEAVKEAKRVTASLTHAPPSPPALRPFVNLLNLANAAYNL